MQEFRRFVRGPVGKVLLGLIILPFVISGFYGYFSGGGSQDTVAEVEGSKITRAYVNSRTERLRQMIRQQSPNVTESMLDSFIHPQMVLEGIIGEQLVNAAAENAGMEFSDAQAAKLIRANPAFVQDGRFSEQTFEQLVRAQGMSPRGYLDGLRQDHISQQYRSAFAATDFALPAELAVQRRLGEQRRDVSYASVSVNNLRQRMTASDQDVQAFYQEHKDDFMRPEQLRVQYLLLTPDLYRDRVKVSDKQIEAEYQARKSMRESASTTREVAHVLIAVDDKRDQKAAMARAEQARQALDKGESFAEVAKQYSDDSASAGKGGSLGTLGQGALPESLESALADLKVGEVSQPVVSDAGVHLLKVIKEDRQTMPPLDQMREQISADLAKGQADALLAEDLARLEELVYEHADLEVPAEQVGLKVQSSDWVDLENLPAALNNDQVRQALNSDAVRDQGHNSDLLDLGNGRYAAVRLQDTQPAEPLPLDQVRDDITAQLKLNKAREKAESLAQQAREQLEQGADMDKIAALLDAPVQSEEGVQRGAEEPAPEVVDAAFSTPRPQQGQASQVQLVTLRNGDLMAFQVTAVEDGSADPLDQQQQALALQEQARVEGQRSFRQINAYLRDSMDVSIHGDRLSETPQQQPQPQ
ncbi:SurA N-terminal domain-containing protein [Alloalcanivorax mobilis]|uniref:SurA N-terminal domain-containing protein n=1 Tax=Alloalcanivorax mobilis TaxID=2019569 RepID=UPI000C76C0DF|nr:SurA N-terminal domain-containing protein [Alloalcanivorax mobilis]